MKRRDFEIELIYDDIIIESGDFCYNTLCKKYNHISESITEEREQIEKRIYEICDIIHKNILELNRILEKNKAKC